MGCVKSFAASLLLGLAVASAAWARTSAPQPTAGAIGDQEVVVGIKEAPPFVMKGADGSWQGISIALWQRVADAAHFHYRFVEVPSVQAQIDGVADGRLDAAIAAITVTTERTARVDFSEPYYTTGLGIAVPFGGGPSWMPILRSMASFGFLQAVSVLIGVALVVGILIWLFERRHNEDFGGGTAKGLSSSFWWSAVAMTQASTGDFGPRTLPGRILAIVWMVASIIAVAIFTAGVTSALTTQAMEGIVHDESDLASVRVGALKNSSTIGYLDSRRIRHVNFATAQDGLKALVAGKIDAFVYDRPLLSWIVKQDFASTVNVLDTTFDEQSYAVALPYGSPLRKPVNVALAQSVESSWWSRPCSNMATNSFSRTVARFPACSTGRAYCTMTLCASGAVR
jgi:ABC-type amino acid transport substrate-binding protein